MVKDSFSEAMVEVPPQLLLFRSKISYKNFSLTPSLSHSLPQFVRKSFTGKGVVMGMTNHPGDRHVLAAAIIAQAEIIVTFNLKHFQKEALSAFGIEAWHPDKFLSYLDDLFPEEMLQVIQQQSKDLKNPPLSILQLLDKLQNNNQISVFAGRILSRVYSNSIVEIAAKILNEIGIKEPSGCICYEGKGYKLWQQGETLIITAKDNRCEILQKHNGEIKCNLSSQDIKTFQNFEKCLEKELGQARKSNL